MANQPPPPGKVHPSVARYMNGVAERAKQAGTDARTKQPTMPNLAQAHANFDAKKDGPMTLGEIGQAQEVQARIAGGDDKQSVFKPETLAGLAEIKKMADQQREQELPETDVVEEEEAIPMGDEEALAATDAMSELDLEIMLSRMNQDVIQNKKEQDAIKKKVEDIDFADGIMKGEFTQIVPIRKGLQVVYRSLTPFENEEIRGMILEMQLQDPRTAQLAAERLSFMQTVAALVMINGNEMPRHLKKGTGGIGWDFDKDVFLKKYTLFANYPTSFIHTLTTHAYWFDIRVRELFTVETAKNS